MPSQGSVLPNRSCCALFGSGSCSGSPFPGVGFAVAGGAAVGAAAATSAVTGSGVGTIRELRASIDADARRTAEQIAKKVSELKSVQRW
jgi:hypothetical protein